MSATDAADGYEDPFGGYRLVGLHLGEWFRSDEFVDLEAWR